VRPLRLVVFIRIAVYYLYNAYVTLDPSWSVLFKVLNGIRCYAFMPCICHISCSKYLLNYMGNSVGDVMTRWRIEIINSP